MAKSDSFMEFVLEQLAPLGEISTRAMMGGQTLYYEGIVFAQWAAEAVEAGKRASRKRRPRSSSLKAKKEGGRPAGED